MIKANVNDDVLKSVILSNGLDSAWATAHKALFNGDERPLQEFRHKYGYDIFRVCKNLNQSRYGRYKKCTSKVGSIIAGGKGWFGTLTFNNSVLGETSTKTRRVYVSRTLKRLSPCYVANIDFGDKVKNPDSNEREHYHFVCYSYEKPDLSEWASKYGFFKVRKCGDSEKDIKKVCKYTAKLSRHALKASTENGLKKEGVIGGKIPRLIYSRGDFQIVPAYLLR